MPSSVYPNRLAAAITSPVMNAAPHESTFETSSLTSMNSASSTALLTVNTSSFARINLQARC